MTIYLYKKTHNKTGLQYLGKTVQDPFKYKGSGKYWVSHINKHGYDVTTEILKECLSNDELIQWGRYYSELWNVAYSEEWANLKPEEGQGFAFGEFHPMKNPKTVEKIRQFQTGRKHTEEHKRKAALPKIGRKRPEHSKKLTGRKRPDQSARMKECQLGPNNHMFGNFTDQSISKYPLNKIDQTLVTLKDCIKRFQPPRAILICVMVFNRAML